MLPPRSYAPRNRAGRAGYSKMHRDFVRTHLCIMWERKECEGPIDFCHASTLAPWSARGVGRKVPDCYGFAACRRHHRESEKREVAFSREYGIDILTKCKEFALASRDKNIREMAKLMPDRIES